MNTVQIVIPGSRACSLRVIADIAPFTEGKVYEKESHVEYPFAFEEESRKCLNAAFHEQSNSPTVIQTAMLCFKNQGMAGSNKTPYFAAASRLILSIR